MGLLAREIKSEEREFHFTEIVFVLDE